MDSACSISRSQPFSGCSASLLFPGLFSDVPFSSCECFSPHGFNVRQGMGVKEPHAGVLPTAQCWVYLWNRWREKTPTSDCLLNLCLPSDAFCEVPETFSLRYRPKHLRSCVTFRDWWTMLITRVLESSVPEITLPQKRKKTERLLLRCMK